VPFPPADIDKAAFRAAEPAKVKHLLTRLQCRSTQRTIYLGSRRRGYGFVIPDGLEVACFIRRLIAVQREQGAEIMADAETQIVNLVGSTMSRVTHHRRECKL
jgi:hypothetical protein